MWSSPSIPPRSIKAPKSVMFLITPVRRSPTLSSSFSSSRFPARSSSNRTRRLTTMFRRRLFSLRILKSYSSPSRSSTLGTRRSAIWDPGRKASTPMRSTVTPPLIFRLIYPLTGTSLSNASLILSQTRRKSAFFFESTTTPWSSSRLSRKTSTMSPSLTSSGSRNSSSGIVPSDLKPTSRIMSRSVFPMTCALTISPSVISLSVSS